MAKKKAKSAKKLMPEKEITVKSRAYGVHTRAARGSKTPIELNDAFTKHKAKTIVINGLAKRVHDLLKVCSAGFKEAMLWQAMLSRMRQASSEEMTDLLATLKGMELNSKYPLQRFINAPVINIQSGKKNMSISIGGLQPPEIKSTDTEYGYELFLLMLGKDARHDKMVSGRTDWIEKEENANEMVFHFPVSPKVKCYVMCLHFMSGKDRKATGTLASRGMRIVGVV